MSFHFTNYFEFFSRNFPNIFHGYPFVKFLVIAQPFYETMFDSVYFLFSQYLLDSINLLTSLLQFLGIKTSRNYFAVRVLQNIRIRISIFNFENFEYLFGP